MERYEMLGRVFVLEFLESWALERGFMVCTADQISSELLYAKW